MGRGVTGPRRALLAALFVALALAAGYLAYQRYAERYVVERTDEGRAVSAVVSATFRRAGALKVGELTGTVQGTATDTRAFGMLTADKVVKAPFSVDYFVDVSRLTAHDYRWDARNRTLTVDAPDVTVGRVNVDEGARTLSRTRGLFVTRDAADALSLRASRASRRAAQAEAASPAQVALARQNARAVLARLLAAPLAAAGQGDVRVQVTFPFERRGPAEHWDTTRSLQDVLGNAR